MAYSTIRKNYSDVFEEYDAVGTIIPGTFLEVTSGEKVQPVSTLGDNFIPLVACEDDLQGKGIGDNYAANDKVKVWIPYRGDQVYGVLLDGETITIGDILVINAAGKLVEQPSAGGTPVGIALEAASPSGADTRITIRIV